MDAIVLAGGFGTRLQSVVKEIAKPMALINDKPFLAYLIEYLKGFGINNVILSVRYKKESIQNYFNASYHDVTICYSEEETPLGTGGAIKKALQQLQENFFTEKKNAAKKNPLMLSMSGLQSTSQAGNVAGGQRLFDRIHHFLRRFRHASKLVGHPQRLPFDQGHRMIGQ